ncbi:iron chaperone [Fructilactobacillus sp. Tb1]|uniref:iron chaperone n=1 Tax=Fructilactobacillus sp. Tb1 TaxID=3422304 RepID=UPI003D2AC198
MKTFSEYLTGIDNPEHREKFKQVINWVKTNYPNLEFVMKYNQPMFLDHNSYITSFNAAKNHYTIGLEGQEIVKHFIPEIEAVGLKYGHKTIQIPYNTDIPSSLFKHIIDFKIDQKKDMTSFWLPADMRFKPEQ